MKIEIVRDHLDYKTGDTPTGLTEDQMNYLIAQGVAKVAGSKTDSPALKQKEQMEAEALEEKNAREKAAAKKAAPAKAASKKSSKK